MTHVSSMYNQNTLDQDFIRSVWSHYALHRRQMPWRELSDDFRHRMYQVVVSEIMLQQTQVERVRVKYEEWISALPDMYIAAQSEFTLILRLWSGLGYNRRAKYLHETLKILSNRTDEHLGESLESLPGIGKNTAGAIRAYACNEPSVYVETNIRTAIIHHYYLGVDQKISDADILIIMRRIIDYTHPREWYWALMDYGAWLKATVRNNARSASYKKQSKFEGSFRQLRGKVLRQLLESPLTFDDLGERIHDSRLQTVLDALVYEQLIDQSGKIYTIHRGGGVK